jgi:capsular polysaccharide export protein
MSSAGLGKVGVFSWGVRRLPQLATFLDCDELVFRPGALRAGSLAAVAGWGHKPTARRARDYAKRHGVRYLALEEGFLRSAGIGKREAPLSLLVDDLGIYYDAGQPSRLERWLAGEENDHGAGEDPLADEVLLARARRCRERIVESGVSKYNHAPDELPAALADGEPYVVVADQTFDDASVSLGLADASTFERMLDAAIAEHPGTRIVVKVHPGTVAGIKRGYLAQTPRAGVIVVARDVNPLALLRGAKHVYVCTSQFGFEALLLGVPVTCFGAPFYAGWGLTSDRLRLERRGRKRSLDQLVAAALLLYPRYVSPLSGQLCQAEEIIEHLALQRRLFAENRRSFVCFGFSAWKQPFVRRYLHAPGNVVRFVDSPEGLAGSSLQADTTAVVWASRKSAAISAWAEAERVPLWNMEDGFLRSVGLGSDLTAPGSLVLDRQGIYYDPRTPSGLETILQEGAFTPGEVERAGHLRERIVAARVSKYNTAADVSLRVAAAPGQRVVLVPGQVEDDASVRHGSPTVPDNRSLLRAVRAACPDAYVLYKPHPDVLSGNRQGAIDAGSEKLWDELVLHVPIAECLSVATEVHTMTSLVGFEALLRGLTVVTYGQPFYAGWGLTQDRCPLPRRTRRLTLDELVAGTLLRYPRYVSWTSRAFCSAEDKVRELERQRQRPDRLARLPRLARKFVALASSALEWARWRELDRAR